MTGANNDPKKGTLEYFQRHMPHERDITLIVLKGHLLMEEEINEILGVIFRNKNHLHNANLRTSQKIHICRAFADGIFEKTLVAADRLNTIRNKLAHNLSPSDINRRLHLFVGDVISLGAELQKHIKQNSKEIYSSDDISIAIAILCGNLTGVRENFAHAWVINQISKAGFGVEGDEGARGNRT